MIHIIGDTSEDEMEEIPSRELFEEIETIQQYELPEFPHIRLCFRILGYQKKNNTENNYVIIEYFVLGQGDHEVDSLDVEIGDRTARVLAQEKMQYMMLLGSTHIEYRRMAHADREEYMQSL